LHNNKLCWSLLPPYGKLKAAKLLKKENVTWSSPPKNKLNSESLLDLVSGKRQDSRDKEWVYICFLDSISILIKQKCEWYLEYYIVCMWWMGMFHILLCMWSRFVKL
jgi:hypothetical protein